VRMLVAYMVRAVATTLLRVLREGVSAASASRAEVASQGCLLHMWFICSRLVCLAAVATCTVAIRCCFASFAHVSELRTSRRTIWTCDAEAPRRRVPVQTGRRSSRAANAMRARPRARARSPCRVLAPRRTATARSSQPPLHHQGRPVTDHPIATKFNTPRDIAHEAFRSYVLDELRHRDPVHTCRTSPAIAGNALQGAS